MGIPPLDTVGLGYLYTHRDADRHCVSLSGRSSAERTLFPALATHPSGHCAQASSPNCSSNPSNCSQTNSSCCSPSSPNCSQTYSPYCSPSSPSPPNCSQTSPSHCPPSPCSTQNRHSKD